MTVRYPWGGESVLRNIRADRIVEVKVPRSAGRARRGACLVPPPGLHAGDRRPLDRDGLGRDGGRRAPVRRASEPVQARDLFDVSSAMWDAWKASAQDSASARNAAISYAAYRVLLWQASFDSNLSRTFALLTRELRALCYSPDFTTTGGELAGGARKPDRRGRDRRRPARRLERVAALRRPDLHVAATSP